MSLLDGLEKRIKGGFRVVSSARGVSKTPKSPRDNVLESIDNSLAYLRDPSFRLTNGRRKGDIPDLVYELEGKGASIKLRYSRVSLSLGDGNKLFINDASDLAAALEFIRELVAEGRLDEQLEKIKAERVAQTKRKGKPAKSK